MTRSQAKTEAAAQPVDQEAAEEQWRQQADEDRRKARGEGKAEAEQTETT